MEQPGRFPLGPAGRQRIQRGLGPVVLGKGQLGCCQFAFQRVAAASQGIQPLFEQLLQLVALDLRRLALHKAAVQIASR